MPQSLSNILVHLVFSTKDRVCFLTEEVQPDLHAYLGGTLKSLGCPPIQIGGVEDHVHLLFALSRTITIAQVTEKVKSASSKWIKPRGPGLQNFSWQAGYGAFSVGQSEVDRVSDYILNQAHHHHHGITFQEELRALLAEAGMAFDERYLWD